MNTDEEVLYVPWLTFYQSSVKTPTFRLWDVDGETLDSKIKLDFGPQNVVSYIPALGQRSDPAQLVWVLPATVRGGKVRVRYHSKM